MAKLILENIKPLVESLSVLKQRWSDQLTKAQYAIQSNFDRLNTKLSTIEDELTLVSSSSSGSVVVKRYFITDTFEIPFPDEPAGTVFIFIITQDSTGIHTVTWAPGFVGMFAGSISLEGDSISSYAFVKSSPSQLTPVLTGMSNVP